MLPFRLWAPLIAALAVLSACGGGGVNTTPLAPPSANGSGTATSNAQVAVPPTGSLSAGTVTLPTVTAGSGASLSIKTTVGSAATSSTERTAESITNATAFAEVTITANTAVTFTGAFVATITYTGGPTTYYGTFQDQNGNLEHDRPANRERHHLHTEPRPVRPMCSRRANRSRSTSPPPRRRERPPLSHR